MKTRKEVRLKNLLIANKALKTEIEKLTSLKEIRLLKNLLKANQILETEIQKLTNEIVLPQKISFWTKPNYKDILEVLQDVLNHTSFRWVDLEIYFLIKTKKPILYPRRTKTQIFVFGNRRFILKNLREIVKRIVSGKKWTGKEVGISLEREFKIEDFISLFL